MSENTGNYIYESNYASNTYYILDLRPTFIRSNMSKPVSTILKERRSGIEDENAGIFDRKIETAIEGLLPCFSNTLYHKLPTENALTIANYIISMKTEINPYCKKNKQNNDAKLNRIFKIHK